MSAPERMRREAVGRLWRRRATAAALIAAVAVAPLLPGLRERAFVLAWALCFSIVGLSMNVLAGYAGQISLAHAVLVGTGAFTTGNLVTIQGVPWLVALPLGGLVAAVIALGIGFPALRIRGLHLAIATLAFQFLMQRVVFRLQFLTGGAAGVDVHRPTIFGVSLASNEAMIWAIMAVLLAVWALDRNLTRSRTGRAFLALRYDEQVAASFGIPVARYKLFAFALSGFYAGLAGGMFVTLMGEASAEMFDYMVSIEFLVFAVLGGLGSRAGTAVGAAFPIVYRQVFSFLRFAGSAIGGLMLVVILIRYQGGLAAQGREIAHIVRLLARRGLRWVLAFAGCVVASVGAGIVAPRALGAFLDAVGAIVRAVTTWDGRLDLPLGLAVVVGLAATFTGFTVSLQRLVRAAIGPAALHPSRAAVETAPPPRPQAAGSSELLRLPRERARHAGPLLEIENLAIRFGGVQALGGVSLEVREGELVGIMGPNGSGKTTLFNCISGFVRPQQGRILLRGREISSAPPHVRARLGIARTFQQVGLVKSETVFANFLVAQYQIPGYGAIEGLVRTSAVLAEELHIRRRARLAIDMLGLGAVADAVVGSLPHGTAKMVEMGCALVSGADLVLLDEPAAGVDPQEVESLGGTLRALQRDFGVTVVMIEHHVPLVLGTCDHVYVLNFGQMLAEGDPATVARNPEVIRAYLGSAAPREVERAAARGV
ncbi:MAG: branched-chain amino acid ABC transporter ATP-binding protein/permease [Acidobacteria bacterium]|nr:branched-chain amino acid ABC transporter ATP-binding protein/permease [Acidobacteriota bacterium]